MAKNWIQSFFFFFFCGLQVDEEEEEEEIGGRFSVPVLYLTTVHPAIFSLLKAKKHGSPNLSLK